MNRLHTRAWLGLVALAAVMALLLFVPAGTIRFWYAWVYLALFFGVSAGITRDLMRRDPDLLERRLRGGPSAEPRRQRRIIMTATSIGFIALHVVSALDFRFGWSVVPLVGVFLGDLLVLVGIGFIGRVYSENTYASATVGVSKQQRVISTGPYAVVRHPMYASALLSLVGTPLALGSYVAFLPLACTLPFLFWRLVDEQRMLLEQELPAYTEYKTRVRYRLVPHVW